MLYLALALLTIYALSGIYLAVRLARRQAVWGRLNLPFLIWAFLTWPLKRLAWRAAAGLDAADFVLARWLVRLRKPKGRPA